MISHVMDGLRDASALEPVLEQSRFSVSFFEEIIKESGPHLGYKDLKSEQIWEILAFVQGNNTFFALPTGYGKSLIYTVLLYVF